MNPTVVPDFDAHTAGGCCYLCRLPRRADDVVVDTGIDIETEGSLALCSTCVTYLASLIGLMPPDRVEQVNGDLAASVLAVAAMQKELERLRRGESTLTALRMEIRGLIADMKMKPRPDPPAVEAKPPVESSAA